MALRLAPGPRGLAFLHAAWQFYRDPVGALDGFLRRYGDIVCLQGGPYCLTVLAQPEHVKHVLQDHSQNYHVLSRLDPPSPVTGRGLTNANGEAWLRHRRLMQPAFHRQAVARYAETLVQLTTAMLQTWRAPAGRGEPVDIWADLLHLNHLFLGRVLFDADLSGELASLLADLTIVREHTLRREQALWALPETWPTPPHRRFRRAAKHLNDFAYAQIRAQRERPRADSMLAQLVAARTESGEGMTDEQLHDEILTLFFAAYEDPANALAWTWHLLAQYPEAEQKLRAEVARVLGQRPPTPDDLPNLPYLTMVLDESLRLYPPTYSLLRQAVNDDEIGGYTIPAGSWVSLHTHSTHRLPQFWEEPDTFDPERFRPDRAAGRPRFAYYPFGGGPRQCIGYALALMEMQLVLAMMTQAYRFCPVSSRLVTSMALGSLRPRGGLRMRLGAVSEV
jgi:cytochrome P450